MDMEEIEEKYDFLLKEVRKRMKRNQDFTIMFTGGKGKGKSWSAIKLGEVLSKALNTDFGIDNIVFDPKNFLYKIKKAEKGDIILFDEVQMGLSSRRWYKKVNKALVHAVEVMRTKNLIVIFTTHTPKKIDNRVRELVDFNFEMLSLSKSGNQEQAIAKPFFVNLKPRENKVFHEYPVLRNERIVRFGFNKPSKELRERYEERRDKLSKETINKALEEREEDKEKEVFKSKERGRELLEEYGKEAFLSDKTNKPSASMVRVHAPELSQRESQDVRNAMVYLIKKGRIPQQ